MAVIDDEYLKRLSRGLESSFSAWVGAMPPVPGSDGPVITMRQRNRYGVSSFPVTMSRAMSPATPRWPGWVPGFLATNPGGNVRREAQIRNAAAMLRVRFQRVRR